MRVPRFTVTERALHWGFAIGYLALLETGLPLMIPALRGSIRGYSPVVGVRLHLAAAVLWVATTVVVVALGNRRVLRATWRDLVRFAPADRAWRLRFPQWLVGRAAERVRIDRGVGRFNAGQKVNAVFTTLTAGLLLLTGLALWPIDDTVVAALLTGSASVPCWRGAHRWLTVLVLLPLAGHVFLAALHPATRPSLHGMLEGDVDRDWAETHHPRWCRPALERPQKASGDRKPNEAWSRTDPVL